MSHPFASQFNRLRYNFYAPFYDRVSVVFAGQRRRAINLLEPLPDERLLIVGAGTGLDLDFLMPSQRLTAVDISPGMLAKLQARARTLGLVVEARVMDGEKLAFADGEFDAVVLHLILAVIPDPVACLKEVERVLKPGGRVVVFDKFLPDAGHAGLLRRSANLLTRLIATDINRRLGDIVAATHLVKIHDETAGLGGFFRIALLRK
jgi:ubiquinone/menaquinone biosynthesis C-methylase UbiE